MKYSEDTAVTGQPFVPGGAIDGQCGRVVRWME
jgi:hypothetical protein